MAGRSKRVRGTCRLCLNIRLLCRSHIIPEYIYKPGYDEKGRLVKLLRGVPRAMRVQQGLREYLLCEDCERHINDHYEKPALGFFNDQIPVAVPGSQCVIEDVPYAALRMMLLSVLWRAGVARERPWRLVDLGQVHEERLRRMILDVDVGAEDSYQTWGYLLVHPSTREPLRGTIMPLGPVRKGARRIHRLIFGGCVWCFCVASHEIPHIRPVVLRPDNALTMDVFTATEFAPFHKAMMGMTRAILDADG